MLVDRVVGTGGQVRGGGVADSTCTFARHDPPRLGDHGRGPVEGVHQVGPLCQPRGGPAPAAPHVKHPSAPRGQRPQEALVVVGIVVPGHVDHGCDPSAHPACIRGDSRLV